MTVPSVALALLGVRTKLPGPLLAKTAPPWPVCTVNVLLFVSTSGHGKRTRLDAFNRQGRGGQGVRGIRLTAERGQVVSAFTVVPGDEVLVFSSAGNIVRIGVDEISEQGRDATGVRVARLGEGDTVVAVARVLETEAETENGEET